MTEREWERVREGERGRAREREEVWKGEGNDRRECRGCFQIVKRLVLWVLVRSCVCV